MGEAEVRSTGDTTFLLEQKDTPADTADTANTANTVTPSTGAMTAPTASTPAALPAQQGKAERICPDPSAHRDTRLQEQASTAALYVTKPTKNPDPVLDANNKLSSRSAAASLKYAQPRDLPSYPVVGINTTGSANAAANLANTNHQAFEHWKPDPSSSAGIAAMAAKDYKMAPLWQPELSAAGSKAALLAHKDGGKLNLWMPEATAEGNSAANLALRNKKLSPQLDYGYTDDGRKRALMAATGALSKSQSAKPQPKAVPAYPDAANSAGNALNAATVAHRPSTKVHQDSNRIDSDAMRAARVQNMGNHMSREMFTERPPVEIEVEEKRNQAALRASAISMAKQMYEQTEKKRRDEEAAELQERIGTSAATTVHNRPASSSSAPPDLRQQAMQYIHLQEAAQKLATERLEKMDPDGVARYRAHYGYEQQSPRSRISLRGRQRRRAESDATQDPDDSSEDELRSRRIRTQMSKLNNSVGDVDKKQQQDRAALLAAAEKRVQAQMHTMDERVFQETGQVSSAMMDEWEAKARARAAADSENRQRNFGKVNIGGGKYMDQSELEAIAQSRLQPTLTEINDNAEKKRARDEEIRLDQEQRKHQEMTEKEKEKEVKAEQKRLRNEEKAQAKAARRAEKEAEKSRKAEEKQARKEGKRRSQDTKREATEAASASAAAHATHKDTEPTSTTTNRDTEATDVDADPTPATTTEAPSASNDGAIVETVVPPLEEIETSEMTRVETGGTHHSTQSGLRPELDRHVTAVETSSSESSDSLPDSDDDEEVEQETARPVAVTPVAVAPVAVVTQGPKSPSQQKTGRLGFFSRFKRNSKAPEPSREVSSIAESKPSHETSAPSTASAGAVAADTASTSSFRRHETDLHSISSISSDEAAAGRGRTSGRVSSPEDDDDDDDDDDEEFEEARDTFDETLAPPPTFGGQLKSQSPIRETKFQEVL